VLDATLKKARFAPCRHLAAGCGCGIYDQRPKSCADFACDWLRGTWGGEDDRPDLSGVIVEAGRPDSVALAAAPGHTIDDHGPRTAEALFVAQGRAVQAWDPHRMRLTIDGAAREFAVVCVDVDGILLAHVAT